MPKVGLPEWGSRASCVSPDAASAVALDPENPWAIKRGFPPTAESRIWTHKSAESGFLDPATNDQNTVRLSKTVDHVDQHMLMHRTRCGTNRDLPDIRDQQDAGVLVRILLAQAPI